MTSLMYFASVLSFRNAVLTLCTTHLAGLHETQQGNEVFDDAEVLGSWRATGVDRHSHQQLLDVTHQELVVIQGNTAEGGQEERNVKDRKSTGSMKSERINDLIHGSKLQDKNPWTHEGVWMNHPLVLAAVPVLHAVEGGEGVKQHVEQPMV